MIQKFIRAGRVAVMLVAGTAALAAPTAYAATDPAGEIQSGIDAVGGGGSTADDLPKLIKSIINVLLFVVGAVAVIMIIMGGIRYVTSNGDQTHVKAAKDTILYSVIGLVVALLAFAIVNFVVGNIK